MNRLVIGVVIAALSLALGSTAAQARAWDPEHPPVWIPVTAVSDRPAGDDGGWNDIDLAPPPPWAFIKLFGFRLFLGCSYIIVAPAYMGKDLVPTDIQSEVIPQQGEVRDATSVGN